MIRTTEIDIHGQEVRVAYKIEHGEITRLRIKTKEYGTVNASNLLYIDSVCKALEAHHANLLEEDNINDI